MAKQATQMIPRLVKATGTLAQALETALGTPQASQDTTTPSTPAATIPAPAASLQSPAAPAASSPRAIPTSSTETRRTATGVVVHLLMDRGFGFIKDDATEGKWAGIEYFLHRTMVGTELFNTLASGQRVQFDAVFSSKGWRAIRIVRMPPDQEVG